MMRASPVVSIQPDHGGSVQLLPPLLLLMPDELAGVAAVADDGGPACAVVGEVVPAWESMSVLGAVRHDGRVSVSAGSARDGDGGRGGGSRTRW